MHCQTCGESEIPRVGRLLDFQSDYLDGLAEYRDFVAHEAAEFFVFGGRDASGLRGARVADFERRRDFLQCRMGLGLDWFECYRRANATPRCLRFFIGPYYVNN